MTWKKLFLICLLAIIPVLAFPQTAGITSSGCTSCTNGISVLINADTTLAGRLTLGTGSTITKILSTTSTIDFASTTNTTLDSSAITLAGAVASDVCIVGVPVAAQVTGASFTCIVTAADTVKVRLTAIGAGIDPLSGSYKVTIIQ